MALIRVLVLALTSTHVVAADLWAPAQPLEIPRTGNLRLDQARLNHKDAAPDSIAKGFKGDVDLRALEDSTQKIDENHGSEKGFDDASLEHIARKIQMNCSTLILSFQYTNVTDSGIKYLAKRLPSNLLELGLWMYGLNITDEAVKAIAANLPRNLRSFQLHLWNPAITDDGLKAIASALPQSLDYFIIDLDNASITDDGMIALAEAFPQNLQSFKLTASWTRVGDDGMVALADNLPPSFKWFHMKLYDTRVGDRGLRALCATDAFRQNGSEPFIKLAKTFVSDAEVRDCKERAEVAGCNPEIQYDSAPTPWPAAIENLFHGDGTVGNFDCSPQDWLLQRNKLGRSAYQRACAKQGAQSDLARCLDRAGGNPTWSEQARWTFGRPRIWLLVIASMSCGVVLALCRVARTHLPSLDIPVPIPASGTSAVGHWLISHIDPSPWFRTLEVASQFLLFCGPIALALDQPISIAIAIIVFLVPACVEHGAKQVLQRPLLAFVSRTPISFVFASLRCVLLAHLARTFTLHAARDCHEETSHQASGAWDYVAITRTCVDKFDDIDVLGFFSLKGDRWVGAANSYLSILSDPTTWQREVVTLPLPMEDPPSFDVYTKSVYDSYLNSLLAFGHMWPIIVIAWLAWRFAKQSLQQPYLKSDEEITALVKTSEAKADSGSLFARAIKALSILLHFEGIAMLFIDMALDMNTIMAMLFSEHFNFAFVLLTVWFTSVIEETIHGDIFKLREEAQSVMETGENSAAFEKVLAREASFDACISIGLTAYAFPFVFTSTIPMITGMLSMLSSCLAMGKYVHRTLDLRDDAIANDDVDEE